MTYKSDDYYKLDRNHTRVRAALSSIDDARTFNRLKAAPEITISGRDRVGGQSEITVSGAIMKAILELAATHCIERARTMAAEKAEEVDFVRAAAV